MSDITLKTRALLTLSFLKGVGPAGLRRVAAVPHFEEETIADLLMHLPRNAGAKIDASAVAEAGVEADKQIKLALEAGARIISSADSDYPSLLNRTKDDPQILFVKGRLAQEPEKSVAIIGTREPTEHGKVIAQRLTGFFVREGWSVVSGLALGCDTLAHEAALDAGGHTVAVLAHGLQTVAPSRNKKLAARILEAGGALVAEYKFGQEPLPTNFVKRDRIQAGLAQGVVMIQSDMVGGSLHASRASIGYGRWLALPFPTDQDISKSEPKIQANLLLANGPDKDRAALLKCQTQDLARVIVLRGKSDYARMLGSAEPSPALIQGDPQADLFPAPPAVSSPTAVPPPAAKKNERVNQILAEHIKAIEDQLAIYYHGLVEHGHNISDSSHYQELIKLYGLLQDQLRRVREMEWKVSDDHKKPPP